MIDRARPSPLLDRAIAWLAPEWAARRARARHLLNVYEIKSHRSRGDTRDGNSTVDYTGPALRQYARHLEQNHDIARGALDRLTQFVVGPSGIGIEPAPKTLNGETDADLQQQLLALWRDWIQWPDVTWEMDWVALQRLACRSWLRDGECLAQMVEGQIPGLDHGTQVPLSIELLEADLLPLDHHDPVRGILQGVERNAWGRPRAYWIYKTHPGAVGYIRDTTMKRVDAERILHLKLCDRIGQIRGVSLFASVCQRLNDLYEYETAERVAARIAASITGVLKTDAADNLVGADSEGNRDLTIKPGMILDNLRPGESIDIMDAKRPSVALEPFRNGQLRAAAAGLGTSYSSLARDYNGTYSAQRQELVEGAGHYEALSRLFIGQFVRPIWQRFVALARLSGQLRLAPDTDPASLDDAVFQTPAQLFIDPAKEWAGYETALSLKLISPQQIIRQRGGNPVEILNQWQQWQAMLEARGLQPMESEKPEPNQGTDDEDEDEDEEETETETVPEEAP